MTHAIQAPHVPVANAAHHVHTSQSFDQEVQLFPLRTVFAVPVSVSVPFTYIANQAGSRLTPVFTVRLL